MINYMWPRHIDSSTNLYLYVEPEEVLQISLNSQDKFGYLEVLYDLINFLLVMTHKYRVILYRDYIVLSLYNTQ